MKTVKILFWGGGNAFLYVSQMFNENMIDIVGIVDKNEVTDNSYKKFSPSEIEKIEYDILMVSSIEFCDEIKSEAIRIGVDPSKILTPYITERQMIRWYYLFSDIGMQRINFHKQVKIEKKQNELLYNISRIEKSIIADRCQRPIKDFYEKKSVEYLYENFLKNINNEPLSIFKGRDEFRRHVAAIASQKEGLLLEFGVYKGRSINAMSSVLNNRIFYGFDSFEGLPEYWHDGYQKGEYSLNGNLPLVNDNVRLIKGWFNETLPPFLKQNSDMCSLIHVDCDLYSSAKFVLDSLKDRIESGTILIFDELLGYINYEKNELLAFNQFLDETKFEYEYLASSFVNNENGCYIAVAVKIK